MKFYSPNVTTDEPLHYRIETYLTLDNTKAKLITCKYKKRINRIDLKIGLVDKFDWDLRYQIYDAVSQLEQLYACEIVSRMVNLPITPVGPINAGIKGTNLNSYF